jgi:hypothetical protein
MKANKRLIRKRKVLDRRYEGHKKFILKAKNPSSSP